MLKKKRTSLGSCTKRFGKAPKKSAKRRTHKLGAEYWTKEGTSKDGIVIFRSPDGKTIHHTRQITLENKDEWYGVDNDSKK
jgi:hypothetical protein